MTSRFSLVLMLMAVASFARADLLEAFDYPDGNLSVVSGGIWQRWDMSFPDYPVVGNVLHVQSGSTFGDVIRFMPGVLTSVGDSVTFSVDIAAPLETTTRQESHILFIPSSNPWNNNTNYNAYFGLYVRRSSTFPTQYDVAIFESPVEHGFTVGTVTANDPHTISGVIDRRATNSHYTVQVDGITGRSGTTVLGDARGLNAVEIYNLPTSSLYLGVDNIRMDSVSIIHPISFTESPGIVLSGDLNSLLTSDDISLVSRPGVVLSSSQAPVSIVVEGTAPAATATILQIYVESGANQANIGETIAAYNFVTGSYDALSIAHPLRDFDTVSVTPVPLPADHIGPGNVLRTRLSYKTLGPALSYPWQVRQDEVTWRFKQ